MLSVDELESLLASGYEGRSFELKGPGSRDDNHFFSKVVKASLSMGNLRDGGHVVLGIDDERPQDRGPGLDEGQLALWRDYDEVARKLNEYADPPLRFELAELELSTGAKVIVLEIHEFEDIPHLCARDFADVLRRGALYVRSLKLPETLEVATSVEMRQLLDLAAEKRLRAYVETAERAGVRLTPAEESDDDRAQFEEQAKKALDD